MKTRTAVAALLAVYLGLSAVGAIFYVVADFGILLTRWVGMLWMFLLCTEILIVALGKKNHVVSPVLIAMMTAMQLPILYTWIWWNGGAVFYLFSTTFKVGLYGAVFHGLLFLAGVVAAWRLYKGSKVGS